MAAASPDSPQPGGFDLDQMLRHRTRADWQINTHISLKNRYVFFQVCKAAGSTVVHHLQSVEFEGSHFKVQDPRNKYLSPHLSPYQLPPDLLTEAMQDSSWHRFAFVRNPFSRLLSCYLHRIAARPDSPTAKWFRRQTGDTKTPSFQRFIEVIHRQSSREMERHWRVQSDEVLTEFIGLDFVGRFEQLRDDLERLSMILFDRAAFDVEALDKVNASPIETNAADRLGEFYTNNLVDLVVERYHSDFELFGYPTSLPD